MNLRDIIGKINFLAGRREIMSEARRLVVGAAAQARKGLLPDQIRGMMEIAQIVDEETSSWLEPDEITSEGGTFDVCDLRVWLKLAEDAGVPFIPAQLLMSVTEDELSPLLGAVEMPERQAAAARKAIDAAIKSDPELNALREGPFDPRPGPDKNRLAFIHNAMSDVMENIPPSWMVRTHLCGASNLKALVGTGMMLKGDDTAEITPGVKLGAGWVQVGNRRRIDFSDNRFIELGVRGHKPITHYLARPWETPARFHEGEDIHRAGSPLAGPGKWPAEWRVFVRNGSVTGAANYYGWTGDGPTPQSAWNAIEACALAQKLIDHTAGLNLRGELMDTFLIRARKNDPMIDKVFEAWDPQGIHATLDFLETKDGLKLLEGGPGHLPGGGGHPCAFAGQNVDPEDLTRRVASCEGVAFLPMEHVSLAEPKTWVAGETSGRILDFSASAVLAAQFAPFKPHASAFLRRMGIEPDQAPEP